MFQTGDLVKILTLTSDVPPNLYKVGEIYECVKSNKNHVLIYTKDKREAWWFKDTYLDKVLPPVKLTTIIKG